MSDNNTTIVAEFDGKDGVTHTVVTPQERDKLETAGLLRGTREYVNGREVRK